MTWHVQKVDLEIASVVTTERYHVPGSGQHTVRAIQAWPATSLRRRVLPGPSTDAATVPTLCRDCQGYVCLGEAGKVMSGVRDCLCQIILFSYMACLF